MLSRRRVLQPAPFPTRLPRPLPLVRRPPPGPRTQAPQQAQGHEGARSNYQGREFHSGDFHGGERPEHWDHPRHRFVDPFWITGYWYEGWFAGLYGWWWVVDGQHYLYDQPVYPYPDVVSEMVLDAPSAPSSPPVVEYAPPQQQQQMWYYCDNPAGYYPYVQACLTPFRAVPAR